MVYLKDCSARVLSNNSSFPSSRSRWLCFSGCLASSVDDDANNRMPMISNLRKRQHRRRIVGSMRWWVVFFRLSLASSALTSRIHIQPSSSLCPPTPSLLRKLNRSRQSQRYSQSTSFIVHDSAAGLTTEPPRRSYEVGARAFRDELLQAINSPEPAKSICASPEKLPTMVNAIDEVRGSCMCRQ
jgi:hypothetical protein